MAPPAKTRPLVALALVAGSVLFVGICLEVALRIEEAVRIDEALGTRLPPPEPTAKAPGTVRILALGDSFTRGVYVTADAAFPGLLESRLGASGRSVEVLNFGIPGTNTVDQLAIAREILPVYEPDVVLLGFFANDIDKSRAEREAANAVPPGKERLATRILRWRNRSYLLRYLSPRVLQLLGRAGIRLPGAVEYAPRLDTVFREKRPRFVVCQDALLALDELTSTHGTQLLVLIFPVMAPFDASYPLPNYHRAMVEFCEERAIPYLDLLPEFRGQNPFRLQVSLLDPHPNEAAYDIVARAVERKLLENEWLSTDVVPR